jgi:hypothetical protein
MSDAITQILSLTPGKRIAEIARRCPAKDDAVRFADDAVMALRQSVLSAYTTPRRHPDPRHITLLQHLLKARKFRSNNVSPLLLLEHAFLNLDNQNTNGYNGL